MYGRQYLRPLSLEKDNTIHNHKKKTTRLNWTVKLRNERFDRKFKKFSLLFQKKIINLKGFTASKCDVGNWILSNCQKIPWFFQKFFGISQENFLRGIFWEDFLGGFLGGIFWRTFLRGFFWEFFSGVFLWRIFWEDLLSRNQQGIDVFVKILR